MKSLNKVFLMGRLGHDPELQTSRGGRPYTRLNIATRRSWTDEDEKRQEVTDWQTVWVWGNQAQYCVNGLRKGALVFVEGQLSPYSKTLEDGKVESHLSIRSTNVTFFRSPSELTRETQPAIAF